VRDSFWFLVAGGAEGGEKRLIQLPDWKQGSSRRRERSSLEVCQRISAPALGAGLPEGIQGRTSRNVSNNLQMEAALPSRTLRLGQQKELNMYSR